MRQVYLSEGCEAVGGAGCVGDDGSGGVKGVSVDSHHVGWDVAALGRGCDQHLLQQHRCPVKRL